MISLPARIVKMFALRNSDYCIVLRHPAYVAATGFFAFHLPSEGVEYPAMDDAEQTSAASLRMRDLPEDELPREKLLHRGRAALTDEELIAIFLRTGLPGCNVLELAGKLKRRAGSLAALGAMEAQDISELLDRGIGPAKAATLAAVFELGARAVRESLSGESMQSPENVYAYMAPDLRFETQENMDALLLDAHKHLLRRVHIAKGTLTRVIVHARDIYRQAIRYNAAGIILVHNHPSGNPTPSKMDIDLTREIAQAGELLRIRLVDHVIIGAHSPERALPYFSFAQNGYLS